MSRAGNGQPKVRFSRAGKPLPDASPTPDHALLAVLVVAATALVGVLFLADSMVDMTRRGVQRADVDQSWTSEALAAHRQSTREALEGGHPSIDEAISDLARRGRSAFPQVRPFQSSVAVEGWSRRPPEAAPPTPTPEPVVVSAPTPSAASDAPAGAGQVP